jgi:hypothetical protein
LKLAWILLTGACAAWAQSSVDWSAQKSEILTHYRDLIRMSSSVRRWLSEGIESASPAETDKTTSAVLMILMCALLRSLTGAGSART